MSDTPEAEETEVEDVRNQQDEVAEALEAEAGDDE